MAKIALITDTHWGIRNDSSAFYDYFKTSLMTFWKVLKDQDIKDVIHLGDLYDRRKYLNFLTAHRARNDFLEVLEKKGIRTHIIAGNHDEYYKNDHVVNALDEIIGTRYQNIKVYTKPETINISGLDILLLPWITDSNRLESMQAIQQTKALILMGHLELDGFEMHKGSIASHGEDHNIFAKFEAVYSGHFHHKSDKYNIHYLGAFAEYSWSDYNDPRGFHVLDTETRQIEFHRNPISIFKMLSYDDVKDKDILKTVMNTDYTEFSGAYVKLLCANRTNPFAFDMLLQRLDSVKILDLVVVEESLLAIDNEEETVEAGESTTTIIDKYVDSLTLPVNHDKMKSYMRNVYNEALTVDSYLQG